MPARKKAIPSYLRHAASNQAYVKIRRPDGSRQTIYLGIWDSPESKAEYARLIGQDSPPPQENSSPTVAPTSCITIGELILRFLKHAEKYYCKPDGTQTSEVNNFRLSLRPLRFLYGDLAADEFGPKCLKAVRELMVKGYTHPDYGEMQPGTRKEINHRINRIRQVFKWAVGEEIIPVTVHQALTVVPGLKAGRSDAKESDPVLPVSWKDVEKTLVHLNPVVAAMVRFQWHTGCRPGEACSIRASEIDRTGEVWFYKPASHKLSYRGKARVIAVGKQGQAVLEPYLEREGYLFSPAHAVELMNAEKRSMRKTPVQPSQQNRKKQSPKRKPGECYDVIAYGRAIARACDLAGIKKWAPNQLRHSFATRVRQTLGLEAAQVALGHAQASITQVYAERDTALASKVAEAMG